MSRDLGQDVPGSENLLQGNFGLIFRSLFSQNQIFRRVLRGEGVIEVA